jgi:hypothetical protein
MEENAWSGTKTVDRTRNQSYRRITNIAAVSGCSSVQNGESSGKCRSELGKERRSDKIRNESTTHNSRIAFVNVLLGEVSKLRLPKWYGCDPLIALSKQFSRIRDRVLGNPLDFWENLLCSEERFAHGSSANHHTVKRCQNERKVMRSKVERRIQANEKTRDSQDHRFMNIVTLSKKNKWRSEHSPEKRSPGSADQFPANKPRKGCETSYPYVNDSLHFIPTDTCDSKICLLGNLFFMPESDFLV